MNTIVADRADRADKEVRAAHVAAIGLPGDKQLMENINKFSMLTGTLERCMGSTPAGEVHPAIRDVVHQVILHELSPVTHANRWAEVEPTEIMELAHALTHEALQFQKKLEAQGPLDKTTLNAALEHFGKHLRTHHAIEAFREPDDPEHGLGDGRHFTGETPKTCIHTDQAQHKKYLLRNILEILNPFS